MSIGALDSSREPSFESGDLDTARVSPVRRTVDGVMLSPADFDAVGGDRAFLHEVKKAVSRNNYNLNMSAGQWKLDRIGRDIVLMGSSDRVVDDLNISLSRALLKVRDLDQPTKGNPAAVFDVIEDALQDNRVVYKKFGTLEPAVTVTLMAIAETVARGHRGLAENGIAFVEPETVRSFLDREAEFSRAMRSSNGAVSSAAAAERKSEAFGPEEGVPTAFAKRTAIKPVIVWANQEARLVLAVTPQDLIDLVRLQRGERPVYPVDITVLRIDAYGEVHENRHKEGESRRAPVAYVLLNNPQAIVAGPNGELPTDSRAARHGEKTLIVQMRVETLARNAERSKTPEKALATLKEAVGESRQRIVQMEIDTQKPHAQNKLVGRGRGL